MIGWRVREIIGSDSVTDAAQKLGVTRATLHRVLSNQAEVSIEMALRLERVYRIDGEGLLTSQLTAKYRTAKYG